MDAISALSVAAATVQFLDFSLQALALCRQIRDDAQGSTAANAQLSAYARDVRNAAQELQRTSTNNTPAGRQIVNVARQCIATSEELTNVLLEVQRTGKPSAFNNAKTTFKAMRGRRTIEKLQNALRAQQERLNSAINHDIRDRVDLAGITQSRQYESIQRQMQQMVFSFDKQQLALQEHQLAILRHGSLLQDRFVADERRSGALSQNLEANHQAVMQRLSGLHDNLNSGFGSITVKDARAKFLGGLFFPELNLRQETFLTPANGTCEWVFQATNSDRFTSLGSWLHTGTAMYWMCGKAGSGKSTLMAHIVGHRLTHSLLSQWATPFPLRVVTFFFWRSGTQLQKSLSGMLRSLIYQLVDSVPDILLPLLTQYPLPAQRYPTWSAPRLVELARLAVEQASKAHKLCIFIDGIDEYDGDLTELLQLLQSLTQSDNVKACVSSRPEAQLVKAFIGKPYTQMEACNRDDIASFVFEKFAPYKNHQSFAEAIVKEAQGVFLWAALVTRSIILGIDNGDHDSILKLRLQRIPAEMTALIKHMAASVDFVYTNTLDAYFNIVKCYHMGIGDEPTLALIAASTLTNDITSYQAFLEECAKTRQRINAQSRGLLEIKNDSHRSGASAASVWSLPSDLNSAHTSTCRRTLNRQDIISSRSLQETNVLVQAMQASEVAAVTWLHRSVHDLIFDPDTQGDAIKRRRDSLADIIMSLLNARIRLLISAPSSHYPLITASTRVIDIVESASKARQHVGGLVSTVLDDLVEVIAHLNRTELKFRGLQRSILGDLIYCSEDVKQTTYASTIVYLICIELGEITYIRTAVGRLPRSAQSCWIITRLLFKCCLGVAKDATDTKLSARTLPGHQERESLIVFLLNALRARRPMRTDNAMERRLSLRRWRAETPSWFDVSFENTMPNECARMECEIVPSLAMAFSIWLKATFDERFPKYHAPNVKGHGQEVLDIWSMFQDFMASWNVFASHNDTNARQGAKPPECVLQTSFRPVREGAASCSDCIATPCKTCSSASPREVRAWRIICQKIYSDPKRTATTESAKSFSTWNEGKHIVLYDLSPSLEDALNKLAGNLESNTTVHAAVWNPESLLWDWLIADVLQDSLGQLDAWQQLFVLACVRSARRRGIMA